jgi:hypothetical protein
MPGTAGSGYQFGRGIVLSVICQRCRGTRRCEVTAGSAGGSHVPLAVMTAVEARKRRGRGECRSRNSQKTSMHSSSVFRALSLSAVE